MRLPRFKMMAGTQAILTGCHSVDEDPSLADLRAQEIAEYARGLLPTTRTVTVKAHVCSPKCMETGDYIHFCRRVEFSIFTRAKFLIVGQIRHRAQSTRNAHRSYSEMAAGRQKESASDSQSISPDRQAVLDAERAELINEWAPLHALWLDLQPYHEQFKYDSIGTLVACVEMTDPDKGRLIVEKLDAIISDLRSPHSLGNVTSATLKFELRTANLESGQDKIIADLLSEMDMRDGGTSVVVSGWHENDEDPELADRRGWRLLNHFKLRVHPNVRMQLQPHVCGQNCNNEDIPVMRRVGWVAVRWQPRYVLLEDIRIAAVRGGSWSVASNDT